MGVVLPERTWTTLHFFSPGEETEFHNSHNQEIEIHVNIFNRSKIQSSLKCVSHKRANKKWTGQSCHIDI